MPCVLAVLMMIFAAFVAIPARANDSEAEMAVGGLRLVEQGTISLDKEELYISPDEVRVDYVFTNPSSRDVATLVAFPLPEQVYSEEDTFRDLRGELNFRTQVDGKPVELGFVQQAFVGGKDVSARLTALKLPLDGHVKREETDARVKALPEKDREALVKDGLFKVEEFDAGQGWQKAYVAIWSLRTSVTRQQVFPAGRSLRVSHRYKPLAGGSVGGNFSPEHRNNESMKWHRERFCIEDSWLKSFDKQQRKRATKDNASPYGEMWLGYVLKSGANWKGPIKDFRLVVDKGKKESLVSFCAKGLKKIAPTQFEMRKKNFEPKEDLNILIVNWVE